MRSMLTIPILLSFAAAGSAWAQPEPSAEPASQPAVSQEVPVAPAVVHWEIMTNDATSARAFYQSLFGWEPMI